MVMIYGNAVNLRATGVIPTRNIGEGIMYFFNDKGAFQVYVDYKKETYAFYKPCVPK